MLVHSVVTQAVASIFGILSLDDGLLLYNFLLT